MMTTCEISAPVLESGTSFGAPAEYDPDTGRATPSVPLYFAFPDGVFHYACAECTALCCRGQGFAGNLGREMGQLLEIYPELKSMAVGRRGELVSFATPAGRCHFLDGDDRCRIEKQLGKSLKPGVCSLFPFNSFTRIGRTVAIRPHFMCPLRLQVPARPGHVEGTHALLEPATRESALLEPGYVDAYIPPERLHPSETAASVLAREKAFCGLCSRSLGHGTFREVLFSASADPLQLQAHATRAARLLGLDVPSKAASRDDLDDLLLALAPSLRLYLLRLSGEGILRALALSEVVLRRVAPLTQGALTPQGAHQTITAVLPALHLLACADEPVDIPRRAGKHVPPFGDAEMIFAGHVILSSGESAGGITDLLESAMAPIADVADRTALLVELGGMIGPTASKAKWKQRANA
jgi:hypothetical protein